MCSAEIYRLNFQPVIENFTNGNGATQKMSLIRTGSHGAGKLDRSYIVQPERAALTETRHDSVKPAIEALAEGGVIACPQTEQVTNRLDQTVAEHRISKHF